MGAKRKTGGTARAQGGRAAAAGRAYFRASRRLAASYVFVAPLLAIYQLGLALDPTVRNGTAPLLREFVDRFHSLGLVFLNLLALGCLLLAIWHMRRQLSGRDGLYGWMFLESCAWTGVMLLVAWFVVPQVTRHLALPPLPRRLVGYVGAGLYEEVLFRLLLLGGLVMLLHRGLGAALWWVVPGAIAASAAAFSWAHHSLGGEPFTWPVFVYRGLMGVVLGGIYWWRGLGIVVYVHALYNMALVALQHVGT